MTAWIAHFREAIVSVNTFNITIQGKNNAAFIHWQNHAALCEHRLNSKGREKTRLRNSDESNVKFLKTFQVFLFPLSFSFFSPLCYFFFSRGTWDSANNCCQQTKQTNYTVSPHCNIVVMDDDVPWKHCKKYSLLLWALLLETIFKFFTLQTSCKLFIKFSQWCHIFHFTAASLSGKKWLVTQESN